jgi:prevent-host-death family protein
MDIDSFNLCTIGTNCTEVEAVTKISVSDAREHLSEVVDRTRYTPERVVLTKRGKDVVTIVSIEDLKLLQAIEDQIDMEMARKAIADAGEERIPLQTLIEKLGL